MKLRVYFLSIFAILANSIAAVAQNDADATLECMYRHSYINDTVIVTMNTDGTVATGDSVRIISDNFLLYCGGSKSIFYSYDCMVADSVFEANKKAGNPSYTGYSGNIGSKLRVYKDFANSAVDTWDMIAIDWFRVEEKMPDFRWQIVEEWKEIECYRVQKATCRFRGRDYEVWFAPDVPVSDGPWKFCGLPGLIFEAYDIPCQYHYRLTGIRKKVNKIEYPDANCISVKPKKFYTTKRRSIENPMLYMSTMYSTSNIKVMDPNGNPIDPELLNETMKYDFQEREF